jgi:two-component system nitrogen regulation sensor histidine kinase NtrY
MGIFIALLLGNFENNKKIKSEEIFEFTNYVENEFLEEINSLTEELRETKVKLTILNSKNKFFSVLQSNTNNYDWISIRDSAGKVIAWNNNFRLVPSLSNKNNSGNRSSVFIENNELYTLLSTKTGIVVNGEKYELEISRILEKYFSLHNKYAVDISFTKRLQEEYDSKLEVNYRDTTFSPNAIFSFPLFDRAGNKLAAVNVYGISNDTSSTFWISLFLVLIGLLLLFLSIYRFKFNSKWNPSFAYGVYILFIRIVLFFLYSDFSQMHGSLTNPVNYSSDFAFGLCSTPLALFFTAISGLTLVILLLQFVRTQNVLSYFRQSERLKGVSLGILALLVYLFLLRSFGAVMRSLLFDSNIKLFNPELTVFSSIALFHILLVLLLALTFFLLLYVFQMFIFAAASLFIDIEKRKNAVIVTGKLFLITLIFHWLQANPQSSIFVKFLIVFFLGHIINWRYFGKTNLLRSLAILLIGAAAVSTMILQRHNTDLENALFKLISEKISRPNTFYYDGLVQNAANEISAELKNLGNIQLNDAIAYRLWSNSVLPREAYSSYIKIINQDIASSNFEYNFSYRENVDSTFGENRHRNIPLSAITLPVSFNKKMFSISCGISWGKNQIFSPDVPPFFVTNKLAVKSYLSAKDLFLISTIQNKITYNSKHVSVTSRTLKSMQAKAALEPHEIFTQTINGKKYLVFPVRTTADKISATSFFAKEALSPITIIFENLKIFLSQLFFVFLIVLILFLFTLRQRRPRLSFSSALFALMLVISLVPMLILAIYFRDLSESKNMNSTQYKLRKRAFQVEKYFLNHNIGNLSHEKIITDAHRDLKIEFSVFADGKLFGSTYSQYYNYGILDQLLNPKVIDFINRKGLNDVLISENIERYNYHAYYKVINVAGKKFVITVNDAFNPILLPMSETDLDTMLITTYSFAFFIIILLGLFLVNRITKPIQLIAEGTKKLALGDLNYKLEIKTFGELLELIEGFNKMAHQLNVSQKRLIEAERETAWREMAKQVAHEIKNPLTPMKLSVQQLVAAQKDSSPKFPAYFDKVTTSLLSQIELLNNIASEFSSLGKMPVMKLEEINLIEILKQIRTLFVEPEFEILIVSEQQQVLVNSDKEYLSRVIVNFLRNAKESGATRIEFRVTMTEAEIVLDIINNGNPISESDKSKIFERSFTTKKDGMGLGLFLSKRYMEQIGGSLELISSNNDRTHFRLSFKGIK